MSSDPNQPQPPTSVTPSVGNPRDIQGILAIVIVIGYVVIAAAVIFAKIVTDPSPILTGLLGIVGSVTGFYFGVKSQTG